MSRTANILFACALALLLVLAVRPVAAEPTSPLIIDTLWSNSRQLPTNSNGSVSAQGGNVTNINIDAITITKSWQGFFGNITGDIRLDDANNNSFYSWGNATSLSGEVYASRNSTIQWADVRCMGGAERNIEETYLGQSWSDGDSVTNTFNKTIHPDFRIGGVQMGNDSCFSTNVFVNGSAQADSFYQILLSDSANNSIYTTILENDKHAYNGELADFQLMVGENEHAGNDGSTAYYFFIEIS